MSSMCQLQHSTLCRVRCLFINGALTLWGLCLWLLASESSYWWPLIISPSGQRWKPMHKSWQHSSSNLYKETSCVYLRYRTLSSRTTAHSSSAKRSNSSAPNTGSRIFTRRLSILIKWSSRGHEQNIARLLEKTINDDKRKVGKQVAYSTMSLPHDYEATYQGDTICLHIWCKGIDSC